MYKIQSNLSIWNIAGPNKKFEIDRFRYIEVLNEKYQKPRQSRKMFGKHW